MFSSAAITYTWKQIFYRLGLEYQAEFIHIGNKRVRCVYDAQASSADDSAAFTLHIQPCPESALDEMAAGKPDKLTSLSPFQFLPTGASDFPFDTLPILFWGDASTGKFAEIQGKKLTLHADILAATFFMLSRYEEIDSPHLDKHGRYLYSASVASRYGLIDLPIVDIYALVLKTWLEALTGEHITPPHRFTFHFSHDVDFMFLSHPFHKWLDVMVRDLAKGRLDFFKQDFPSLFQSYTEDVYYRDLRRLVEMAQANGGHEVFYLLTSREPFARDGYSLKARRVRTVLEYLKENGMEIGLHASYRSYDKPALYKAEKQRLEMAIGRTCRGSRQHYLRIRTPYTWNQMKAAGLEYDESYCFSEHEGFRCGTCYPYPVFDVQQDRELDFTELPLIVMETSLRVYRKLSAAQGIESIMKLAHTCQKVNGTFTMLWHNTCLDREWQEWGRQLPDWVKTLTEMAHQ
ncbi:polysaccharide deacetylase family protein [Pelolinea submarina]|uniref:DUF7033 domain-containing protein n=1 Tax=Pelolinea submarina TaxID=913107 RepID=A0A347ZW10_9CHLR|nr:polysaccharide deacetylase family protein [Pelolinea submarina]REG07187.1 hypothetical protein DFR64_2391 [Pelolinea submarina]BBB49491.1 hypothetical protein Pelsub_P2722 [Pelolinea submarina]